MATRTRVPAKTKRRRDNRVAAKPRKKKKKTETNGEVAITEDRLVNAKEAERHLNDARLKWEEAKAKSGQAKAEHKLEVAKRNRVISVATTVEEVQEAQHAVTLARRRMVNAKDAADEAKEEFKGWEEALTKSLSEPQPLFEELKNEEPEEAAEEAE